MKIGRFSLLLGAVLVFPSLALAAETYAVDPVHSAVIFKVKHAGAGYTYGRFRKLDGTIVVDGNKSSVQLNIDPNSIYTGQRDRDKHLKSPDFLNTRQFPTLTFKSKTVQKRGKSYLVKGDLDLHGKTRPITVRMKHTGNGKGPKGTPLIGFEGSFTVKRSDFGISKMASMVGEEVTIIVAIEGARKE